MKVKIEFDTLRTPYSARIFFDGVKQGYVQSLTLDMDINGINDFRLRRIKEKDGRVGIDEDGNVEKYVETLEKGVMVVAEGQ